MNVLLIATAVLLLVSVAASKVSDRLGVPALLLFLVLGMLAGSDGPGGIYFDDPVLAQSVGVVALILILFAGGLDTEWRAVRPVVREATILATVGVFITALVVGLFASNLLDIPLVEGLLIGAIVSSTDAAAVFSVLRSRGISLRGRLKPLLELESGSNDPMAIFLTTGLIQFMVGQTSGVVDLVRLLVLQMLLGAAIGYVMGRATVVLVNRAKLGYEGLYPVLTLALVFLTFGITDLVGGSGFLAVYASALVMGHRDFVHKRSLQRFHDGLAWLMQIAMFLTLGLLVFPSRLPPIAGHGLLLAACLMFVARPVSVFIGLAATPLHWREKALVSWVGLRGAVPIILATFPLLARIPDADMIFNLIFFVVLTSVLVQGTSIPIAARLLRVDAPATPKRAFPIEYVPMLGLKSELKELHVPMDSVVAGQAIVDLHLPDDLLVILLARGNEYVVPSGGTVVRGGDTLLILSSRQSYDDLAAKVGRTRPEA